MYVSLDRCACIRFLLRRSDSYVPSAYGKNEEQNNIENTKNTETPENSEIPKNPEGVKGGFAIVSDPIYKLTYEEEKGLGAAGYNLKRTNSGNYRITNEDGKMASPLEIQTLCKVINRSKNKNKSVWTYIFHM